MGKKIINSYLEQFSIMEGWINQHLNSLSDDDLKNEIAPGRNTGVWTLGHLIASMDDIGLYLSNEDKEYKDYLEMFGPGSKPASLDNYPSINEMRDKWKKVNEKAKRIIGNVSDEELENDHNNKTDPTDFYKTKKKVIDCWILHQMYHAGQLGIMSANKKK